MKFVRYSTLRGLFAASLIAALTLAVFTLNVHAGEVDVVDVTIESLGDGKYRISATLAHDDTGWDHYADRWDVLDESGQVIGVRELAHPHVNEQPFTPLSQYRNPGFGKNHYRAS